MPKIAKFVYFGENHPQLYCSQSLSKGSYTTRSVGYRHRKKIHFLVILFFGEIKFKKYNIFSVKFSLLRLIIMKLLFC